MSAPGVRRAKAALSSGCKPHPASLHPEAIGAVMEVTKWLNGLEAISLCDFGSFGLFAGNFPHGILGVLQHRVMDGSSSPEADRIAPSLEEERTTMDYFAAPHLSTQKTPPFFMSPAN